MLQSWNKFCFTGGIIEISASLPGSPNITVSLHACAMTGRWSAGLMAALAFQGSLARCLDDGQPWKSWVRCDDGRNVALVRDHSSSLHLPVEC